MRFLYNVILYLTVPAVLLRMCWRSLHNRAYLGRVSERFGFSQPSSDSQVIWLHAVSVGEVRATVPLVQALSDKYPDHRILMTTMTLTGSDQVRDLFDGRVDHCYVPYDLRPAVNRFLDRKHPVIAIIMETEIWPNLFSCCSEHGIPVVIANARLSSVSARGYKKFYGFVKETLSKVSRIGAQSRLDVENILEIGAPPERTKFTGSIKFEFVLSASLREAADSLRHLWGNNRMVWLAASTHEGEDELVLNSFRKLKEKFPELLLVLVPRHPERFASVHRLCRRSGIGNVELRSENQGSISSDTDILLGDTMGELQLFYAAATVAFVGGSLVNTGGHNILEPAAVGTPAVFGPYMFNFIEISKMALESGAALQVSNEDELTEVISSYLAHPNQRHEAGEAGKRLVRENRGALQATMEMIDEVLANNQAN